MSASHLCRLLRRRQIKEAIDYLQSDRGKEVFTLPQCPRPLLNAYLSLHLQPSDGIDPLLPSLTRSLYLLAPDEGWRLPFVALVRGRPTGGDFYQQLFVACHPSCVKPY